MQFSKTFPVFQVPLFQKKTFIVYFRILRKKCTCKSGKRQNVKNMVGKLQNIMVLKISNCLLLFLVFTTSFFEIIFFKK